MVVELKVRVEPDWPAMPPQSPGCAGESALVNVTGSAGVPVTASPAPDGTEMDTPVSTRTVTPWSIVRVAPGATVTLPVSSIVPGKIEFHVVFVLIVPENFAVANAGAAHMNAASTTTAIVNRRMTIPLHSVASPPGIQGGKRHVCNGPTGPPPQVVFTRGRARRARAGTRAPPSC